MTAPLLRLNRVRVAYPTPSGLFYAVDDVSFEVQKGETVGVVGESGCGKTTLARAILGLEPVNSGSIELCPESGAKKDVKTGLLVGMVWQDPSASLNPKWTVARSISEAGKIAGKPVEPLALMEEVGLDRSLAQRYPHELSGGQRQRVAIGRAIALRPELIVCDEPTAALDLSIRAQILNLLKEEQARLGCSFLYISHDLPTVRFLSSRIVVMYLGKCVEIGPSEDVFSRPMHPYTKLLLDSIPSVGEVGVVPEGGQGEVGNRPPSGCVFAPRCRYAKDLCAANPPSVSPDHHSASCHFPRAWDQN